MADNSRVRVVIRGVLPEIECGRFPIKRTVDEVVEVEADVFADGHDRIACVLRHRHIDDSGWEEIPMAAEVNDHWRGSFTVQRFSIGSQLTRTVMSACLSFKTLPTVSYYWRRCRRTALPVLKTYFP